MFLFIIGLGVVACIIFYKRSTEIVKVNPIRHQTPGSTEPASQTIDFARIISTIQDAAAEAAKEAASTGGARLPMDKGRAAILAMVRNQQFIEAIKRYREVYGVDLRTAKKAVDEMMLEE